MKIVSKQVWQKMGEVDDDGTDRCPLCLHIFRSPTHYCPVAHTVITWSRHETK